MIKGKVKKLVRKYGTNDPFVIAREMGIMVVKEPLGSIRGYYSMFFRIKQIHVNSDLPEHLQKLTAAHELGHAVLHPKENTPFLLNHTFLSVDRLENEANKFAVELLIPDSALDDLSGMSAEQIAGVYGYEKELIELRIK